MDSLLVVHEKSLDVCQVLKKSSDDWCKGTDALNLCDKNIDIFYIMHVNFEHRNINMVAVQLRQLLISISTTQH